MPIEDAVKESKDGVIIDFEVNPGSRSLCIPSGAKSGKKSVILRGIEYNDVISILRSKLND